MSFTWPRRLRLLACSMPVLDRSVLARRNCNKCLEASHVRTRLVRRLNISMRKARIVTSLQSIGMLLRGLHVLWCRDERLKPRVRPRGLRLLLHDHLLLRHGRMRSVVYLLLVLIFRPADCYCDGCVRWVWLVRIDDDWVVLAALLGKRRRNAIATAGVFGRWATKVCWSDRSSIPCLALVTARRCRLLGDRRWVRLDILRRHADRLRHEVAGLLYDHCLTRLPVSFLRWCIRCSDVEASETLIQSSIGWAVRAQRPWLAIHHHRA